MSEPELCLCQIWCEQTQYVNRGAQCVPGTLTYLAQTDQNSHGGHYASSSKRWYAGTLVRWYDDDLLNAGTLVHWYDDDLLNAGTIF